jgi:hypothetical protein
MSGVADGLDPVVKGQPSAVRTRFEKEALTEQPDTMTACRVGPVRGTSV